MNLLVEAVGGRGRVRTCDHPGVMRGRAVLQAIYLQQQQQSRPPELTPHTPINPFFAPPLIPRQRVARALVVVAHRGR